LRTESSGTAENSVPGPHLLHAVKIFRPKPRIAFRRVRDRRPGRPGGPRAVRAPLLARYRMNAWRMLAPEIHLAPKSTKHKDRAQVAIGGTARETQALFFTDAEAREWATTGPATSTATKRTAVPVQPGPVQLQKPTAPAAPPADFLTDAWSTTPVSARRRGVRRRGRSGPGGGDARPAVGRTTPRTRTTPR
jgi:hypothetical protein